VSIPHRVGRANVNLEGCRQLSGSAEARLSVSKLVSLPCVLAAFVFPANTTAQDRSSLLLAPVLSGAAQDTADGGRNVFSDFGGGVVSLGEDALDFVTAPFHLDRPQALQLGAVVAAGGLIFLFDQEIHDWVLRTQGDAPWQTVLSVGEFFEPLGLMNNTNPYWLAGIAVSYVLEEEALMRVFQQLLFSHIISGVSMAVAHPLVGRERPHSADGPYEFNFREGTSFPSGHTSTIFEVARVLSHNIGWWPASVALYGMAGSVAYQRMAGEFDPETGELTKDAPHWPSDVWFGAWWGVAVSNVIIGNDEEGTGPHVQTGVDSRTGALWMSLNITF